MTIVAGRIAYNGIDIHANWESSRKGLSWYSEVNTTKVAINIIKIRLWSITDFMFGIFVSLKS